MMNQQTVGSLKKISLSLQAGSGSDKEDIISAPLFLEIIFGIGQEGLTPLEYVLSEKSQGDTVQVVLKREEIPRFFDHNLPFELVNPKFPDTIHVRIRIEDIGPAEGREVVQAMAALAGDCACSCGCGGHGTSPSSCEDHSGCGDSASCEGCGG
ncbi:MAG: hypothetical protein ACOC3A_03860 [Thermodesulfobacteriota bacterium]